MRKAIQRGSAKFSFLKDQRDNITHYKSAVMIFGDGPDFEFAIVNPAWTMPVVKNGDTTKLVLKNAFRFTNEQHLFLWEWMNGELTDAIVDLAQTCGIPVDQHGPTTQLSGGGAIKMFKKINNITQ